MTSSALISAPKTIAEQMDRLVSLGIHSLAGISEAEFRALVPAPAGGSKEFSDASVSSPVVVISPQLVPAATLAPLLTLNNKPGFVVVDMTDLAEFVPLKGMEIPESPLYLMDGVDRGDEFSNWSPDEALPVITSRERTAMTVSEGISWLLQYPELLVPNFCFMTIASRKPKGKKLDSRTPALWISGGTGRDGKENKGAPKVGWCWAGNRHTWLGIASVGNRLSF
ncbi:DUF5701 family protein [Jonesiaceae bacterium BS-20]|uniref:DUF5701 family protein n=1 Tax=Jonesiaceae bacterium BS-20 TaxID=3120821 RepID=A0AAU7DV59_9MICO